MSREEAVDEPDVVDEEEAEEQADQPRSKGERVVEALGAAAANGSARVTVIRSMPAIVPTPKTIR
jgi:hypothetical protein